MLHVTDILAAVGVRRFAGFLTAEDLGWYLNRGKMIHKATELYDGGVLDLATLDDRIKGFVGGWMHFRAEVPSRMLAIEEDVSHARLGYCGRLDRIIKAPSVCRWPCMLDIKTNEADIGTRLQLSGYKLALGRKAKQYGRMAVELREDGTYKLTVYYNDREDAAAWIAAVSLASWMNANGYKIERERT